MTPESTAVKGFKGVDRDVLEFFQATKEISSHIQRVWDSVVKLNDGKLETFEAVAIKKSWDAFVDKIFHIGIFPGLGCRDV